MSCRTRRELEFFKELLAEFNDRYEASHHAAMKIVRTRAKDYDSKLPVWYRVPFPHGFSQEITKKAGRVESRGESPTLFANKDEWPALREELHDLANYAHMMASYGDMLAEEEVDGTNRDVTT